MKERCKKIVSSNAWHAGPCSRYALLDGFCKQHHPEARKERAKQATERFEAKMAPQREIWRRNERFPALLEACKEAVKFLGMDRPINPSSLLSDAIKAAEEPYK